MKITIHPPIESDVDVDKCNPTCRYCQWQGLGHYWCSYFDEDVGELNRCQQCLDAEKESKSINLKEKQHEV